MTNKDPSRAEFEVWFSKYHEEACREWGGIDCTNPKGVAEEAWQAALAKQMPKTAPTSEVIAGALFDFLGYLATLPAQEAVTFSECHETSSAVVHLEKWAEKHSLSLDEADLFGWHTAKAVQKIEGQKRLPLTYEQKVGIMHENTIGGYNGDYYDPFGIMEGVETAHGIK